MLLRQALKYGLGGAMDSTLKSSRKTLRRDSITASRCRNIAGVDSARGLVCRSGQRELLLLATNVSLKPGGFKWSTETAKSVC